MRLSSRALADNRRLAAITSILRRPPSLRAKRRPTRRSPTFLGALRARARRRAASNRSSSRSRATAAATRARSASAASRLRGAAALSLVRHARDARRHRRTSAEDGHRRDRSPARRDGAAVVRARDAARARRRRLQLLISKKGRADPAPHRRARRRRRGAKPSRAWRRTTASARAACRSTCPSSSSWASPTRATGWCRRWRASGGRSTSSSRCSIDALDACRRRQRRRAAPIRVVDFGSGKGYLTFARARAPAPPLRRRAAGRPASSCAPTSSRFATASPSAPAAPGCASWQGDLRSFVPEPPSTS